MANDPYSASFSYKKYSLEQLDNWLFDAMNCEDLTPQDIYDTVVNCVDHNVKHHQKHLERNTELLSLLKGHRSVDFDDGERSLHQEYNIREAEYYKQRAMLDAKQSQRKH